MCRIINKSTSISPPWNSLGAKSKSYSLGKGRTSNKRRAPCNVWEGRLACIITSCAEQDGRQPWTTAKGGTSNNPLQPRVQLESRFAPVMQDPGSPPADLDNLSSPRDRVRTESKSTKKQATGKAKDCILNSVVRSMCTILFVCLLPKWWCLTGRFLHIVAAPSAVKKRTSHWTQQMRLWSCNVKRSVIRGLLNCHLSEHWGAYVIQQIAGSEHSF